MDKEIKHEHEIALSSLGMQARKDIGERVVRFGRDS